MEGGIAFQVHNGSVGVCWDPGMDILCVVHAIGLIIENRPGKAKHTGHNRERPQIQSK